MGDTNLFGETEDHFKSALDRYGHWPMTTWEIDYGDAYRRLKAVIGDQGSVELGLHEDESKALETTRAGCFKKVTESTLYRISASVFHPVLAAQIVRMFAPPTGLCFDPFAGGGTRAVIAAKHGLAYLGVELRADEAEAVRERCRRLDLADSVHIEVGDSRDCSSVASSASADFLLTCPPYWNLERYRGGPADLSMTGSYDEFLAGMRRVIAETHRVLKPGATSCWVVGLHRDKAGLIPLHHAITRCHLELGFQMREEVIVVRKCQAAIQRVGNFEKGRKLLVRTHEYLLIFTRV